LQTRLPSTDLRRILPFGFENLLFGFGEQFFFFLDKKSSFMERTNKKTAVYNEKWSRSDLSCKRYGWGG